MSESAEDTASAAIRYMRMAVQDGLTATKDIRSLIPHAHLEPETINQVNQSLEEADRALGSISANIGVTDKEER